MVMKKTINDFRKRNKFCPAANFDINCAPILGNFSSLVIPHPEDYPSQVITTGYWILSPFKQNNNFDNNNNHFDNDNGNDNDVEFEGKERIEEFFRRSEEKPIYMGFGSMPVHRLAKLVEMLLNVCIKLKKIAIFCGRYTENEENFLAKHEEGGRILLVKGAPHEWLLPKCLMAIHHGGAGTTAASMRASIPTIIYPVIIDQPFWAARIVDLKVGQNDVCELRNITEQHLLSQIQHCLKSNVQNQSRVFGEKLCKENGCAFAAQKMVSYFSKQFKNHERIKMNWKEIKWSGNGKCGHCLEDFGVFNSPANCMVCGDIFCAKCLRQIWLANYGYVHQNVCNDCHSERQQNPL